MLTLQRSSGVLRRFSYSTIGVLFTSLAENPKKIIESLIGTDVK